MDHSIYVAMQGASQTLVAQAINNNNLANIKTTGFKADLQHANSISLDNNNISSQVYVTNEQPIIDLTPGAIVATGRELDVAIEGNGLFAVLDKQGKEVYTRAGNFSISEAGILTTAKGDPVQGNSGIISLPPTAKIDIGYDGTISILPQGQTDNSLIVIDRLKLVNHGDQTLVKDKSGYLQTTDDSVLPTDASVKVIAGSLEASNVNAIDTMVNMISLSRQYEVQMKLIQAAKENDESTAQLLQTR